MVKCKTIDIEVPATAELVTSRKKQSGNNTPKGFALMILGLWSNNSLETFINSTYFVRLVAWCRVCKGTLCFVWQDSNAILFLERRGFINILKELSI